AQAGTSISHEEMAAGADRAFQVLENRFLDEFSQFAPVDATRIGDHRHDGEIDDLSVTGRGAKRKWDEELLAAIGKIDRTHLSRAHQVDAALLTNSLRYDI